MNEEVVIRGLLNREEYKRYVPVLKSLRGLEREHKQILNTIGKYWEDYPEAGELSPDELVLYFNRLYPALKDVGLYDEILGRIKAIEITNSLLLQDEMRLLIETQYAGEILKLALLKVEGQEATVMQRIKEQIEKYEEAAGFLEEEPGLVQINSLSELLAQQHGKYGWRLPFLQEQIGAPPGGTLGHVYAYSEVGKTTFAAFCATGFAYKMRGTTDKVVYLGNEEGLSRTTLRAVCSYTGKCSRWFEQPENAPEADRLFESYQANIAPHLYFIDDIRHYTQVERALSQYKPTVVFIDQGPKVKGPTNDTGPAALQSLYNFYREAAKRYSTAIITLGQADKDAQNKYRLTLGHMHGSKVDIPGELDYAIGISSLDGEGKENLRYLSVTKNKLGGLHGHYRGSIDVNVARYK